MSEPEQKRRWEKQIQALWPALKGSVAKVFKPCIRKNCPACARGERHPAWMLSLTLAGRRKTMYVPLALVSQVQKGIRNGRKLEELLYRAGQDLIKEHRRKVKGRRKPKTKS